MAVPSRSHISQDDLIPHIIRILQRHGGRARKSVVDEEMYELMRDVFEHPWYHETVSKNVPRWKHNVAWAKDRARQRQGLIKPASQSGHGYWELTEKGKNYGKRASD